MLLLVVGLQGEAHEALAWLLHAAQRGGNVVSGLQVDVQAAGPAVNFGTGHPGRLEVGHGGTQHGSLAAWKDPRGGGVHLVATLHVDALDARRARERHRTGHKRDLSAAAVALLGQSKAHLAARVVAYETHRVDFLVGGSCGDENVPSLERGRAVESTVEGLDDGFGLLHAPLALKPRGEKTGARLDDAVAIAAQCGHVVPGGRMAVHVEVHGRRYKHRRLHRQVGGNEHVVGNAIGHLAQGARRAGRDEHGIGPQAQVDVRVPRAVALREKIAHHRLVGERTQGNGGDKLLAGRRDHHLHLGPALDEAAHDEASLVGCNRASDAKHYFLSF